MEKREQFGSRLGMMLAMLGMAVGTGNIWRFPRIAAKNGGGEFLIAWVVFLFLWSIPLILLEFAMGRKTRRGPVRAFMELMGPRWAWMGAFAAFVTTAITCYYSVVAGWTVRYAFAAVTQVIPEKIPGSFWTAYTTSAWPVLTHALIIGLTVIVVAGGVRSIEKVAKILMPLLLGLVLILTVRALTLPGAADGLGFLFHVDWNNLGDSRLWLEALTQNAWDTGAGWGLVLCYAAYMREREDTALNAFILPMANNAVSLTAAVMVFCTVFSVVPALVAGMETNPELLGAFPKLGEAMASGAPLTTDLVQETIFSESNEGITFIWMPQLFARIRFGGFLMFLFFAALAFAAFTSMLAMVEVATRTLVDAGLPRRRAIVLVGAVIFVFGVPSALNMDVLANQDWVWGVALMVAGLFFAIAAITHGVRRLREEHLNHEDSDIHIGRWWDIVITYVVPFEAIALFLWLLWDARGESLAAMFTPKSTYNVGTVLVQFAVVLGALALMNRWIVKHNTSPPPDA